MALKDTINHMNKLICNICEDLEKAVKGNKAASQRVRTGSIKFEKIAKNYRKESVSAEKKGGKSAKKAKPAKKAKTSSGGKKPTAKIPKRK